MDEDLLASHVDAVYGLPLDEFTAERDRRVKALRADGHRAEATALKAARKPTVPVWAVNRLARVASEEVVALVAAGDELRGAQHRAASGRGADGLREATREVRRLTQRLRGRAADELRDAGTRPDTHLDDVERTLFAAAVDPDWQQQLCRGVLSAPVTGPGFGGLGLAAVPTDTPAEPAADERRAKERQEAEQGEADREAERREAERREAERLEKERREAEARQRAARRRELLRRVDALESARDKQAGRVERREEQVADLRARTERAQREVDSAREDLAGYERDLTAAREELARLAAEDEDAS